MAVLELSCSLSFALSVSLTYTLNIHSITFCALSSYRLHCVRTYGWPISHSHSLISSILLCVCVCVCALQRTRDWLVPKAKNHLYMTLQSKHAQAQAHPPHLQQCYRFCSCVFWSRCHFNTIPMHTSYNDDMKHSKTQTIIYYAVIQCWFS